MEFSGAKVPIFVDTNLGTHIAVPISPDITAKEFKREFAKAHLNCFPELGRIKVNGLMVKRKACFYHLSESLPIKYVFQGPPGNWFLQIEVHQPAIGDQTDSSENVPSGVCNLISTGDDITDLFKLKNVGICDHKNSQRYKRKKGKIRGFHNCKTTVLKKPGVFHLLNMRKKKNKNVKRNYTTECPKEVLNKCLISEDRIGHLPTSFESKQETGRDPSLAAEAPSETLSESISVSGIIRKYFSNNDEEFSSSISSVRRPLDELPKIRANARCLNVQSGITSPITYTPLQVPLSSRSDKSSCEKSRDTHRKLLVGKCLLMASNSIRSTQSNRKHLLSLCKSSEERSRMLSSVTSVRKLVFDMSDEDD